jgi:hypothetical protein
MPEHPSKTLKTAFTTMALLVAALAAGPGQADDKEQAKAEFNKGLDYVAAENYPAALAAFEKSYELRPKASVLFNIGMCLKALYRYVESLETFRRYLEEAGPDLKPELVQQVSASMAEMNQLVGHLRLVGAPDGAEVRIDGRVAGQAPFDKPLPIDPGHRVIEVALPGHLTQRIEVDIETGGEAEAQVSLTQVEALLRIECEDPDAVVRVDGEEVGGCPFEGEVTPGPHRVEVEAPVVDRFEKEVVVEAGSTATVDVDLSGGETVVVDEGASPLFVAGIVSLAAGVGAGVVGGVFTYKGSQDQHDMKNELDAAKYNELKDELNMDNTVSVIGYVAAGALITTGVVLLVVDAMGDETTDDPGQETVRVVPTPGGMMVSF